LNKPQPKKAERGLQWVLRQQQLNILWWPVVQEVVLALAVAVAVLVDTELQLGLQSAQEAQLRSRLVAVDQP
jgi:hypothetical protein